MYERLTDSTTQPTDEEMLNAIGWALVGGWNALRHFLAQTYGVVPTFNPGGKKYGWNLQYRLSGRPLCEMYPEHGSFTALVILGKAELDQAMLRLELFDATVQKALVESPRFHDGCWMYMRVTDPRTCYQDVLDIEQLILIKKKPTRKRTFLS
jgi:hypothetical protein